MVSKFKKEKNVKNPDRIIFPNEIIFATKNFRVEQDWSVPIPGFFVIISKRKISSVAEFTDEEAREFIRLLCTIRRGMKNILGIKTVYLFQNEDTDRKLFHPWIFPRYKWMEKFGNKIESVRPIINYAKEHMKKDEILQEVRDAVKKMKEYMERCK